MCLIRQSIHNMLTGVESAGLVLAIFPLIIEALKSYSTGMETIKRGRQYKSILTQYYFDLTLEQTKFNNTWKRIVELIDTQALTRIHPDISLAQLSQRPQALPDLRLKEILSFALTTFDDTDVENFEVALEELLQLLGALAADFLELELKYDFMDHGNLPDPMQLASYFKSKKKILKMLKEEIKGRNITRTEQLLRIRQRNDDLFNLVSGECQGQILASIRSQTSSTSAKTASTQTKLFNVIQTQAKSLYDIFHNSLVSPDVRCCQMRHDISLRLEVPKDHKIPETRLQNYCRHFSFSFGIQNFILKQGESSYFFDLDVRKINFATSKPSVHTQHLLPVDEHRDQYSHRDNKIKIPTTGVGPAHSLSSPKELNVNRVLSEPEPSKVLKPTMAWVRSVLRTPGRHARSRSLDGGPAYLRNSGSGCSQCSTPSTTSFERRWTSAVKTISRSASAYNSIPVYSLALRAVEVGGTVSLHPHDGNAINGVPQIVVCEPDEQSIDRHQIDNGFQCRSCTLPNDQIVTSLCFAVHTAKNTQDHNSCIGILSSACGSERFRVCPCRPVNLQRKNLISLRELVGSGQLCNGGGSPTKLMRLKLGVRLASSVMQLHGTGWLKDSWSSRDILFEFVESIESGHAHLDRPLVREFFYKGHDPDANISHAAPIQEDDWASAILFSNSILFSLGIVLMEIYHWKSFQELWDQHRGAGPKALMKVVEELGEQAGFSFQAAVQRCIQGLDHKERDLKHEDFKKEVYQKVVALLEDELKYFCQETDLQKIFFGSSVP